MRHLTDLPDASVELVRVGREGRTVRVGRRLAHVAVEDGGHRRAQLRRVVGVVGRIVGGGSGGGGGCVRATPLPARRRTVGLWRRPWPNQKTVSSSLSHNHS